MTVTDQDYLSLRNMLCKIVLKIQNKYGGDFDDLMSEANECFMLACHSHNPNKSRLITWVHQKVWYGLLESARVHAKRNKRYAPANLENVQSKLTFDVERLLSEVSADAANIINLIVYDNKDKRSAVIQHLLSIGWAAERILESFREIKDALK